MFKRIPIRVKIFNQLNENDTVSCYNKISTKSLRHDFVAEKECKLQMKIQNVGRSLTAHVYFQNQSCL